MESLLDEADALVRAGNEEPARPDFRIPEEYSGATDPHKYMVLKEAGPAKKGRGWFATQDIKAGTLLNVAKPLAMVMDWEDDSGEEADSGMEEEAEEEEEEEDGMEQDEKEPRLNELLLLRLLKKLADEPHLWTDQLSTMFPRDDADLSALPAWICQNDDVFMQVESLLSVLEQRKQLAVKEISKRLPLIIRYNILSIETCSELLSYPGPEGYSALSGVGLYHAPSFFNHSAQPNVSRWAVGDVMCFVANQNIASGTELCISYMEHDVLCEPAWRRNLMLSMDFKEADEDEASQNNERKLSSIPPKAEQGPELPVVDSDVQNELMSMDPFERLSAIDELMQQALGNKLPQDEERNKEESTEMIEELSAWFQCDVHNLRILKAITLDSMGKTREALKLWEESVEFVESKLPPSDESSVVLHAQAALCSLHADDEALARQHAAKALETHQLLFGGGVARFRRRLDRDLKLSLRPTSSSTESPVDKLWPPLS